MDRGTRRAIKARIRSRLYRMYWERVLKGSDLSYPKTAESSARIWRGLLRNEGKSLDRIYPFGHCDCSRCIDDKLFRARREAARIEDDYRAWLREDNEPCA